MNSNFSVKRSKQFFSTSSFRFIYSYILSLLNSYCRCAYLVGNVEEYITLSLELTGRCILENAAYHLNN